MIFSSEPIPVQGQLCREFGHMYVTTYDRSWKSFFRKNERTVCVACDPDSRYEALQGLRRAIHQDDEIR